MEIFLILTKYNTYQTGVSLLDVIKCHSQDLAGGRTNGFMPFSKALAQSEMQTDLSSI